MRIKLSFVPFLSQVTGCKIRVMKCTPPTSSVPLRSKVQEVNRNNQAHILTQNMRMLRQLQAHVYAYLPSAGYIYPAYTCSNCVVERNLNINELCFSGKDSQGVLVICQNQFNQYTLSGQVKCLQSHKLTFI